MNDRTAIQDVPQLEREPKDQSDVRDTVERQFTQMNEAHDRIRSQELAIRLGESDPKRGFQF